MVPNRIKYISASKWVGHISRFIEPPAFKDALQAIIIVGKVIKDKVIPPTKGVDLGNWNTANKIPKPKRPNTIDGTAAKLLIFTSIKSVNLFLGANSSKYIAAKTATGKAIAKQTKIENIEPINELAIPANSASL